MARIESKRTWAIHETCAETKHSESYTWREVMRLLAFQHQIKVYGLSEANQRDWPRIAKYRAEVGVREVAYGS